MSGRTVHLEWFAKPGPRAGYRDAAKDDDGLRFECTQCGACCTGPEGYVLFTEDEAIAMAADVGVPLDEFHSTYTRETVLGRSLTERETVHGNDCVFLDRDTIPGKAICGIYESRPAQCRTWPFWGSNLSSERAWQLASNGCPGIDRGEARPPTVIREQRDVVDI